MNNTLKVAKRIYRILIVDDFPSIIESVKLMLEDINGFIFESARNGVEAYTKIKTFHPDLIILDVEMHGGNGDELLSKIKKEDGLKNIKVLGYTGFATEGKFLEYLGADKVIIKGSKENEITCFQHIVINLLGGGNV